MEFDLNIVTSKTYTLVLELSRLELGQLRDGLGCAKNYVPEGGTRYLVAEILDRLMETENA